MPAIALSRQFYAGRQRSRSDDADYALRRRCRALSPVYSASCRAAPEARFADAPRSHAYIDAFSASATLSFFAFARLRFSHCFRHFRITLAITDIAFHYAAACADASSPLMLSPSSPFHYFAPFPRRCDFAAAAVSPILPAMPMLLRLH